MAPARVSGAASHPPPSMAQGGYGRQKLRPNLVADWEGTWLLNLTVLRLLDLAVADILITARVVVSGETGCGKTTQLPQYILESEIEAAYGATCSIICTQARRISAISVSERVVAKEVKKLGDRLATKFDWKE